jgi:uncharacterized protein
MPEDPTYPGLYVEEIPQVPHPIAGVPTSITAFIGVAGSGPLQTPISITSLTEFESHFGSFTSAPELWYAVRAYFQNGGTQALIVRIRKPSRKKQSSGLRSSRTRKTGLYALERAERFNLLCLTPLRTRDEIPLSTYREALAYCREKRAMLLIDAPADWEPSSATALVRQFVNELAPADTPSQRNSANAMMYFPRIWVDDPSVPGALRMVGSSGAVAGLIARTDETHGVWKAPAGTDAILAGVADLPFRISDDEARLRSSQGVNCLRPIQDQVVVWGARTLDGHDELGSEWKYGNVRRLALFVESSIAEGLTWVAFEPNGEPLWTNVRQVVEDFLVRQWNDGALSGITPKEAFFVKCDQSTMTQDDLDHGRLVCLIGIAPVRPAEFIILQIVTRTADPPA